MSGWVNRRKKACCTSACASSRGSCGRGGRRRGLGEHAVGPAEVSAQTLHHPDVGDELDARRIVCGQELHGAGDEVHGCRGVAPDEGSVARRAQSLGGFTGESSRRVVDGPTSLR